MNYLKLTSDKLNLNDINDLVVHETCGGVAFFVGTTRDYFEDKKVSNRFSFILCLVILCCTLLQISNGTQHKVIYAYALIISHKVLCLEYEAYESMAIKSMTTICDEIRCNWMDIQNIAIFHRLGVVPVKEASVVIGVSSPHRKTCLDAVQHAIDELKKTVPIWKKEKYSEPEGTSDWKENKECSWSSKT